MTNLLQDFEDECVAADIAPADALDKGGLHPTNWWRWKSGKVSPSLKNFGKAQDGLRQMIAERQANAA